MLHPPRRPRPPAPPNRQAAPTPGAGRGGRGGGAARQAAFGATATLAALAATKLLLQLIGIRHYGFFRDELYYMACGEHLAWGYVDQPPLIALVAWFERHAFGNGLAAVRLL